jgi:quercetin dioxygenase-like cupin family protein
VAARSDLVSKLDDSALALESVVLDPDDTLEFQESEADALLLVDEGSGRVALPDGNHPLEADTATLVAAGETATLTAGQDGIVVTCATAGPSADRHAPLGARQQTSRLDRGASGSATGSRAFQILLGPHNGSRRATMFVGFVPPGKAPWHYHLYDEIVMIRSGSGRLHVDDRVETLEPGSVFRLRPRQVHIVENASSQEELVLLGVFTPAGSPSAAYLPADGASHDRG